MILLLADAYLLLALSYKNQLSLLADNNQNTDIRIYFRL